MLVYFILKIRLLYEIYMIVFCVLCVVVVLIIGLLFFLLGLVDKWSCLERNNIWIGFRF